ncbi:MAG: hypothetical protein QOE70_4334 [Chthoniobacter sp.]|jgi:metal-responsive CopG/Arc/MetJ family transcriptional regulator|nr:hypothetical protein [Chthoniobacter sp.]
MFVMKARPISMSMDDELEAEMEQRRKAEHMTRSEYLRKCIREEIQRYRVHAAQFGSPTPPLQVAA